jgi:hypothetical protein
VISNFGLATSSGKGTTTIKAAYTQGSTTANGTATLTVN